MPSFVCRLFGGRDVGVSYDGTTLTVLGQSISVASLSAALQQQLADAAATTPAATGSRPAFGGSNMGAAVGAVLDNQPATRAAAKAVLDGVAQQNPAPV